MPKQWIHRRGSKTSGFRYVEEGGKAVSKLARERIDALRIPPAWRDVHIAASSRAPIQAWGYDARGRKQYRYHVRAVQRGELRKYYRVRQMARDLPLIRQHLARDFRRRKFSKPRVLAGIVRLIGHGCFRVGSERYLKENRTFGITTLRKSHVHVARDCVTFDYVGKRSIKHRQVVVAKDLARFVAEMLDTPGTRLFRYEADGDWYNITARDVNEYIQLLADFPYTAKDLRTWGGTLRAAVVLAEIGPTRSESAAKRNAALAVRLVAAELGNTPAICRKSYVHPVFIERYIKAGETIRWRRTRPANPWAHTPEERAVIGFLDEHFPERRRRRRPANDNGDDG